MIDDMECFSVANVIGNFPYCSAAIMFGALEQEMRRRGISNHSMLAYQGRLRNAHATVLGRCVAEIDRSELVDWHEQTVINQGPAAAQKALSDYSRAYDYCDLNYGNPRRNPARNIHVEPPKAPKARSIPLSELRLWTDEVEKLRSPVRRYMHRLGLLAGLTPHGLLGLRWSDVDFANSTLRISGNRNASFSVPISRQMKLCLFAAQNAGNDSAPGSQWVFPSSADTLFHFTRTDERSMPGLTGFVLRRTYSEMAARLGIQHDISCSLLGYRITYLRRWHGRSVASAACEEAQQQISDEFWKHMST